MMNDENSKQKIRREFSSQKIREKFLSFFEKKDHLRYRSDSILPNSPNLMFTNAGMNQFVPIFLGEENPPAKRIVNSQKCLRAGGKHNDLEDVGLDGYHHTFFEMLGNWSFGDYFKKEAIEWALEFLIDECHLPPERIYATIYEPGPGEPGIRDDEAEIIWQDCFKNLSIPTSHIIIGRKKDNFWMMGETGPCGPCSEIHFDLSPDATAGDKVNAGHRHCMEIWNLVFIQYSATQDGQFIELPQRHIDTGMSLERLCSLIQCTNNFQDFSENFSFDIYDTDHINSCSSQQAEKLSEFQISRVSKYKENYKILDNHLLFNKSDIDNNQLNHKIIKQLNKLNYRRISNYNTDCFEPIFEAIENLTCEISEKIYPDYSRVAFHLRIPYHGEFHDIQNVDQIEKQSISPICSDTKIDQLHPLNKSDKTDKEYQEIQNYYPFIVTYKIRIHQSNNVVSHIRDIDTIEMQNRTNIDTAFRIIADHTRAVVIAIADGIEPGNKGRNYVIRKILRRAILFGSYLNFRKEFIYQLVDSVDKILGDYFHNIRTKKDTIRHIIQKEEELFWSNFRRAERIIQIMFENTFKLHRSTLFSQLSDFYTINDFAKKFESYPTKYPTNNHQNKKSFPPDINALFGGTNEPILVTSVSDLDPGQEIIFCRSREIAEKNKERARYICYFDENKKETFFHGKTVFFYYETYGLEPNITKIMLANRGLSFNQEEFDREKEFHSNRSRKAQKQLIIEVADKNTPDTQIMHHDLEQYDKNYCLSVRLLEYRELNDKIALMFDKSYFYPEIGGQIGDQGWIKNDELSYRICDTQKQGKTLIHLIENEASIREKLLEGSQFSLYLDIERRQAIARHHTATHLLHHFLRQKFGKNLSQKGSFVGSDELRFDFNSPPLTLEEQGIIEKLVNLSILANYPVFCFDDILFNEVAENENILQFFGEKYPTKVRVVKIGGTVKMSIGLNRIPPWDGLSMELCAGSHVRATGEIGLFKILSESSVASGIRRIQATVGISAYQHTCEDRLLIEKISQITKSQPLNLEKKINEILMSNKLIKKEIEKYQKKELEEIIVELVSNSDKLLVKQLECEPQKLELLFSMLLSRFQGVIFLVSQYQQKIYIILGVTNDLQNQLSAQKLLQIVLPLFNAQGGGNRGKARGKGQSKSPHVEMKKAVDLLYSTIISSAKN